MTERLRLAPAGQEPASAMVRQVTGSREVFHTAPTQAGVRAQTVEELFDTPVAATLAPITVPQVPDGVTSFILSSITDTLK